MSANPTNEKQAQRLLITTRDVPCPFCKAEPGEACIDEGRLAPWYHLMRQAAFGHAALARRRAL